MQESGHDFAADFSQEITEREGDEEDHLGDDEAELDSVRSRFAEFALRRDKARESGEKEHGDDGTRLRDDYVELRRDQRTVG